MFKTGATDWPLSCLRGKKELFNIWSYPSVPLFRYRSLKLANRNLRSLSHYYYLNLSQELEEAVLIKLTEFSSIMILMVSSNLFCVQLCEI